METAEASDEHLMRAFQSGDARAFEALVRRHRAQVFHFILRSTGEQARAEDLLQETWLKVVRGASGYQPTARFTTWLYTVARNLCVDSSRKEKHRRAEPLEEAAEHLSEPRWDPERGAADTQLRPLLTKALEALPEEQREVFVLREYCGVTFKEIASVTGVSENTVKSRMRYALEALRKHLLALGVEGVFEKQGRTAAG